MHKRYVISQYRNVVTRVRASLMERFKLIIQLISSYLTPALIEYVMLFPQIMQFYSIDGDKCIFYTKYNIFGIHDCLILN